MRKLADIEKEDREEHDLEDPEKEQNFSVSVLSAENNNQLTEIINKKEKNPLLKKIVNINKILKDIRNESVENEEIGDREIKWKFASIVFDRLLMILSIIYYVIVLIAVIISIPNFYKPI